MIGFTIVDFDTHSNLDELRKIAGALNLQIQDFSKSPPTGYGIGATVRVATGPTDVHPDEWVVGLVQDPDVAGALGYHDETPSGKPYARVFPLLNAADGVPVSTVISHEILETLVDPNVARCAQWSDSKFWAYEVCDACEATSYSINGVAVSNFVLPPYFEPVSHLAGLKLDHLGLITHPLQILPGGYGQYWNSKKGWVEATGIHVRQYRKMVDGRSLKRRRRHP